jgi:hypothetical protein
VVNVAGGAADRTVNIGKRELECRLGTASINRDTWNARQRFCEIAVRKLVVSLSCAHPRSNN